MCSFRVKLFKGIDKREETPNPPEKKIYLPCSFTQQKALTDVPTPGPPHMGEHVTRS